MDEVKFQHIPVLADEVIENIITDTKGIYIDCTLGMGGHSGLILERLKNGGKVVGIDRDRQALNEASSRLEKYGCAFVGVIGNFKNIEGLLRDVGVELVDGILVDLGVSSYQLDTAQRGFSYSREAPLDMRMSTEDKFSAYEVVNNYSLNELARVLREYGEEKFARSIAKRILENREKKPISTTQELVEIIKEGIPARARRTGGHPAKRTFQAIRIEVNSELEGLKESITAMAGLLKPGGRLCVISFHSLEDRIVKQVFRELEDPCTCPDDAPECVCGKISIGKAYPRKGIVAGQKEQDENSRSKSARLRVFIKS